MPLLPINTVYITFLIFISLKLRVLPLGMVRNSGSGDDLRQANGSRDVSNLRRRIVGIGGIGRREVQKNLREGGCRHEADPFAQ